MVDLMELKAALLQRRLQRCIRVRDLGALAYASSLMLRSMISRKFAGMPFHTRLFERIKNPSHIWLVKMGACASSSMCFVHPDFFLLVGFRSIEISEAFEHCRFAQSRVRKTHSGSAATCFNTFERLLAVSARTSISDICPADRVVCDTRVELARTGGGDMSKVWIEAALKRPFGS